MEKGVGERETAKMIYDSRTIKLRRIFTITTDVAVMATSATLGVASYLGAGRGWLYL